jgi:hypothetical protein
MLRLGQQKKEKKKKKETEPVYGPGSPWRQRQLVFSLGFRYDVLAAKEPL